MLSVHQPTLFITLFWTIVVVDSAVVLGVFPRSRRFLQLSVFPPALLVALSEPLFIWNVFAFLAGHPPYLESPGAIFVVLVIAIMVTLHRLSCSRFIGRVGREVFVDDA